ncbi:hypothetical protein QJS04_geneDACA003319 [Acorus gramineus]|uniref:Uncharacterized protein n=1 Tax=Acorus gramineus TaxID=55184 RepID=A0AAV9BS70_ACOGR|nr:hypothetical protein QJS04_geneDACA003319 [Acorus gramineus]
MTQSSFLSFKLLEDVSFFFFFLELLEDRGRRRCNRSERVITKSICFMRGKGKIIMDQKSPPPHNNMVEAVGDSENKKQLEETEPPVPEEDPNKVDDAESCIADSGERVEQDEVDSTEELGSHWSASFWPKEKNEEEVGQGEADDDVGEVEEDRLFWEACLANKGYP